MGVVEDYKIEAWTLFGCGCMIVFFRLFARWRVVGFQGYCLDDYLMVLALVFDATLNTLAHFMMKVGVTNSKIDMATRESFTQHELDLRATGSKIWMSGWCSYTAVVWTLKLCMIIFFNRVMTSLHRQNLIKWAFWITGISGLCVYLVFWLTCFPTYKLFQTWPYPGKQCEAETPVFYISTLCFNVLSDIFIISIPLPVLWNVRLPLRRKLMILLLFCGGFFVIISAILRCVLGLTSPVATTTAQWACRETFVAIVIGNAPMIKPLFSRASWSLSYSSSKQTGDSNPNSKSASKLASNVEMYSRPSAKKDNKAKTFMSMIGDTVMASDSQENIIGNESEMGLQRHASGDDGHVGEQRRSGSGSGSGSVRGLHIVADVTYTISCTNAADIDLERQGNVGGGANAVEYGQPPVEDTGRFRPTPGGYTIFIEGGDKNRGR